MTHHNQHEREEKTRHRQHEGQSVQDREQMEHARGETGQATGHDAHAGHGAGHDGSAGEDAGHGVSHAGHEEMFRRRFWVSLLLSIPVLVFSSAVQDFLGYNIPAFPGSDWITPVFSVIVFAYGGIPFLQMAVPELRNRKPGMMTLISLAISVALVYSLATLFLPGQTSFFWELVTLIDIMLLGHWIEMRSVRQASGALDELAKLMPDTAERVLPGGDTEKCRPPNCRRATCSWCGPAPASPPTVRWSRASPRSTRP
jgi:P-type Cu2+ transporter